MNTINLPLIIESPANNIDLKTWITQHRSELQQKLIRHGAILLRNFALLESQVFQQTIQNLDGDLLPYIDRATPRKIVEGNIYTSTEYPPSHRIFLHNENAFAYSFPGKIFFYCVIPPNQGGETPIANIANIYQRISPKIRESFREKGVMYVRNFGSGYGLSWQETFGTNSQEELGEFCAKTGIDLQWISCDHLRTRQVRPAILQHPQTGDRIWFNHAAVLNISTLKPLVRNALLEEFAMEDLPNNTYYGDGTVIESEVIEQIRDAYEAEKFVFPWQKGDLLILDNLLVAHGREPYKGNRKVWVGMTKRMTWDSMV